MSAATVVIMATRLPCRYGNDPCYRHDGSDRRYKRRPGFETCDTCSIRRLAEYVQTMQPRPPQP